MEVGPSLAREVRQGWDNSGRETVGTGAAYDPTSLELIEANTFKRDRSLSNRLDVAAKRALDVMLALVQVFLTAPLWIVLSIAIKLEDGGPVFFRQVRVGQDGERFEAIKFRSMVPDDAGDRMPQQDHPDEGLVTSVGKLMRSTALDESPQLWNILKGDMSYVGPRAVPPKERSADNDEGTVDVTRVPGYQERHMVRPGLTGLAQVHLRRGASHRVKFDYDVLYVRSRTLWLDLKLIVQSVWISLRGAWPAVGK